MQERAKNGDRNDAKDERGQWRERRTVHVVIAVGLFLVIVVFLALIGRRFGASDLPQFVTGNLINVLIFAAIVGQVLIYRKQRDIMQEQRRAMYAQLEIMSQSLTHDFEVSKIQFEDMQIQWKSMGQQVEAMNNQTGAMINQTTLMALSLEETRKIAEQNADVVKAMQGQLDVMKGQTAVAERSLKLGTRAYVCLSDLQVDFTKTKQLSIKFENIGRVPAEKLDVRILITVTFPDPKWVISDEVRPFNNYEIKRNYGVNALYPGTFKAEIRLWLEHYLNETEMLLGEGKGFLSVVANVYYGDGFDENQGSAFVFTYRDGGWTMHPVWPDSRGSKSEEDREDKGENPN